MIYFATMLLFMHAWAMTSYLLTVSISKVTS